MADKCVGEALPVGALDSSLDASSSLDDAGTGELGIGLARLRDELNEFEELIEGTEARNVSLNVELVLVSIFEIMLHLWLSRCKCIR